MPRTQRRTRAAPAGIDPVAALRGFFPIAQAWRLTAEDARALLGAPAEGAFHAWRAGNAVRMPMDTLRDLTAVYNRPDNKIPIFSLAFGSKIQALAS